MLVHDSSVLTCEPPSWTGQTRSHCWLSSKSSLANGFAYPTQSLVPLLSSLAGPQTNAGHVQHLQAASGAGPAPGSAEKDFSLLLPGSGCSYLQSVPIQLPPALQPIFLACSKSFSRCPRVSTLSLARALTRKLNASAQRWYSWPSCVHVNTRLHTATQGDPNSVY